MDIRPVPLKEVWLLRHAVMYQEYPEEDVVKLKDDELGTHLGIYKNGELASVVSVFQQGREMQFRKLATRKDWQGKGLATALLHYIDHLAKQEKVQRLWCNARLSATGLYEKMGMHATGQPWQALGQEFIVMEKKLNQH